MSAALGRPRPFNFPSSLLQTPRAQRPFLIYFLIASALLHGAVLLIHFTDGARKQDDEGARPLQVVLVNSKSARRPHKADALAQANLDGGGNTDAKTVATSPFPVLQDAEPQQELKTRLQQVKELEQQQARLLTQLKAKSIFEKPAPALDTQPVPGQTPDADDLMARSFEMARLEAQIARDHNIEDWRLKIERVGNLNYPDEARQKKLYGSLQLTVHIKADGKLDGVDVDRSSGSKILDEAAVRIVKLASPYAAFPEDIRRDFDILDVTRTWTFTRSDQLAGE
jgi:protein TonB